MLQWTRPGRKWCIVEIGYKKHRIYRLQGHLQKPEDREEANKTQYICAEKSLSGKKKY